MDPMLKGNYPLDRGPKAGNPEAEPLEHAFEAEALRKLGGSIAFVKKSAGFVWMGPDEPDARGTPGGEAGRGDVSQDR